MVKIDRLLIVACQNKSQKRNYWTKFTSNVEMTYNHMKSTISESLALFKLYNTKLHKICNMKKSNLFKL